MFKCTIVEKYKAKGLPVDDIAPEMRNRFNAMFGNSKLDGRFQVRLDERALRFFYYDYYAKDEKMTEPVIIEEYYKEVASVSLTNRKETGQDILYIKNQAERKSKDLKLENMEADLKEVCRNLLGESHEKGDAALFNYPFLKMKPEGVKQKNELFVFFVQCCFLYFIMEFEDRESDFSNSPLYDEVRNKLRDSVVYQLLCAKTKYTFYLHHDDFAYSQEEYTFKTQKFVDFLMDGRINKIIPPYYYNYNLWFYDPEIELDLVVNKNHQSNKDKGGAKLDSKLQEKVRDFFFRHDAVISGMGSMGWKTAYCVYLIIIGVFSIWATCSLLMYDEPNRQIVNSFFENIYIWDIVAFASVVFLLILSWKRSVNVFMPRVLVALGIGWLTAFISEDLIKSQLEITQMFTILASVAVMALIAFMLFGEAKQHSPYFIMGMRDIKRHLSQIWKYPSKWKLLPIIIHAYFWALTTGVVMQFTLYEDLLKNSRALPEIVYADSFEEANEYILYLSNMKSALTDYRNDLDSRYVSKAMRGVMRGNNSASFLNVSEEYVDKEIGKMKERGNRKINNINDTYDKIVSISQVAACDILQIPSLGDRKQKDKDVILNYMTFGGKPMSNLRDHIMNLSIRIDTMMRCNSFVKLESFTRFQLDDLDDAISLVDKEIQDVNLFISENNNYENLIKWSQNRQLYNEHVISYCDYLQFGSCHQHFLCRKVKMLWVDPKSILRIKEMHLFPRMLIFHSLIVLIIAFVGQLIVSDKSVTEPL